MRNLLLIVVISLVAPAAFSQTGNLVPSGNSIKADDIVPVNIAEVVTDPNQYDGIKVSLEGVVKKVKYTKSSKGEDFTVFELKDSEGNKVGVYYEDEHLPIEKGDTVKISGKFRKQKKYFLYKIKNVIKARTVEIVDSGS